MHRDKAALPYAGQAQLTRAFECLMPFTDQCFVSVRSDQKNEPLRASWPQIIDQPGDSGPLAGILAAQQHAPHAAWWVLACDLPRLEPNVLQHLRDHRNPDKLATAYLSTHDHLPEPLCTLYEPASQEPLQAYAQAGGKCPRKFLLNHDVNLLAPISAHALDNVNSADEYWQAMQDQPLHNPGQLTLKIKYFALLREQAGCANETVHTEARSASQLYAELKTRHPFTLPQEMLKVALNGEFAEWSAPLATGDEVVFIPPVAGG
jgi:molybdopterin-guanine dinucleotide biosynthesis protein A